LLVFTSIFPDCKAFVLKPFKEHDVAFHFNRRFLADKLQQRRIEVWVLEFMEKRLRVRLKLMIDEFHDHCPIIKLENVDLGLEARILILVNWRQEVAIN
jgi:hypothetical protein